MTRLTGTRTLVSMWDTIKEWAPVVAFGATVILGLPILIYFANVILPSFGGGR
jgi:hypothetical protein